MKRMNYVFFVSFILLCVIGINGAYAHGSGVTLDQVVGDYVVSLDYNATTGIYAGSLTQFAFELFSKDRSQKIDFTDIWVHLASVDESRFNPTVFSGGITGSALTRSGMAFTFPASGSYTLSLRYEKGDEVLAEVAFPLDVLPGEDTTKQGGFFQFTDDVFKGGLAVIILWFVVWLGRKMLQKKKAV